MALLTPVVIVPLDDTNPALVAASSGGDTFKNGRVVFVIQNTDASPHTATIESFYAAKPGSAGADIEIVVPAGAIRLVKGFGDAALSNEDGNVSVTYDGVTGVKVGVVTI